MSFVSLIISGTKRTEHRIPPHRQCFNVVRHSSDISEITMQLTRSIYLTGLVLLTYCSFAQTTQINKVNTSAAEAYFKVADAIKSVSGEDNTAWQLLFGTPIYQMMIAGKAIDTIALKAEMKHVFAPSTSFSQARLSAKELYHKSYKDNRSQLDNYIGVCRDLV